MTAADDLLREARRMVVHPDDYSYMDRDVLLARIDAHLAAVGDRDGWLPIESAPKDNKRMLYLAHIVEGELKELDFDGIWQAESESWEMPEIYYYWASANGIEEPTHWSYQDKPLPAIDAAMKEQK